MALMGHLIVAWSSLKGHGTASCKSCLLPNMRQALVCSNKKHCKQLRLGALVWQAGRHPDNNDKTPEKKQVFASLAAAARPEIRNNFGGNGAAAERDFNALQ